MATFVVGTSAATGRLLVEELPDRRQRVRGILRRGSSLHRTVRVHEKAADFLRTEIGHNDGVIEWAAIRPATLVDESHVTEYGFHASPIRSAIFDSGSSSQIRIGHFMADLTTENGVWARWKRQMPVVYDWI